MIEDKQMMEEGLEIEGLVVALNEREILHGVNLRVHKGELVSLLGPSGCGKSTLLKTIAGLLELQKGNIRIGGKSVLSLPTEKRGVVIVFQDLRLFPHLTVAGNIEFALRLRGVPRHERAEVVRQLLEVVKLPDMGKRKIGQLSGGQMQRVALARALAAQPELLLLDEPFSSLNEELREEMRSLVQELHRKYNMTIILVTHDKGEALSMSDRIALMIDGELVQVDTPKVMYQQPVEKRVADYFGGCTYLCGHVEQEVFHCSVLQAAAPGYGDGDWQARIRPSMVHLQPGGDWEITRVRYQGESSQVILQQGEMVLMAETVNPPPVGKKVGVQIDTDELLLFPLERRW